MHHPELEGGPWRARLQYALLLSSPPSCCRTALLPSVAGLFCSCFISCRIAVTLFSERLDTLSLGSKLPAPRRLLERHPPCETTFNTLLLPRHPNEKYSASSSDCSISRKRFSSGYHLFACIRRHMACLRPAVSGEKAPAAIGREDESLSAGLGNPALCYSVEQRSLSPLITPSHLSIPKLSHAFLVDGMLTFRTLNFVGLSILINSHI